MFFIPLHCFYVYMLSLHAYFPIAYKTKKKPNQKTSQKVSIQTDTRLYKSHTKWNYLKDPYGFDSATTPWISVKLTWHILWGYTPQARHIFWVCNIWYLQFRREDTIKKLQDLGWPLLRYVHKWKHTVMLAWFGIEIVITVVREGNYTEDFRI